MIGIGAFPLRPDQEQHAGDGSIIINANSSEQALRRQIRHWLEDDNGRERLLEESIPQKGLEYTNEPVNKGPFYIAVSAFCMRLPIILSKLTIRLKATLST